MTERDRTTEYTLGGRPMLESQTPQELLAADKTTKALQFIDEAVIAEVVDEGPFAINRTDVFTEEHKQLKAEQKNQGLGVDFWLQFPIAARPLKFVPGRNRREKRQFRALADQQERGTISKGNQKKINRLYSMLASAGVLKQAK